MNPIARMRANRQSRFSSPFSERLAVLAQYQPEAASQLRDRVSPEFDWLSDKDVRLDFAGVAVQGGLLGPEPSIDSQGRAFFWPDELNAWLPTWQLSLGNDTLRIKADCMEHFIAIGAAIKRVSNSNLWLLNWKSAALKAVQDFTEYDIRDDLEAA